MQDISRKYLNNQFSTMLISLDMITLNTEDINSITFK